jgi:hypothetical protein
MYVGAPLQHNWGDRDQIRGWCHVSSHQGTFNIQQVPSNSPRFVKLPVMATSEIDTLCKIMESLEPRLDGRPGIVELTLIGDAAKSLDIEFIRRSLMDSGVRELKIIVDRTMDHIKSVSEFTVHGTPEDKWSLYLKAGIESDGLDHEVLTKIGIWSLHEAKHMI